MNRTKSSRRPSCLIEVLLHRQFPFISVHAALETAERLGSVDPALVAIEARRIADRRGPTDIVKSSQPDELRCFDRAAPSLERYDALLAGGVR